MAMDALEEEKLLAFASLKYFVQQLNLAQNQLPVKPAVPWTLAPSSGLHLLWKSSLHYGFRTSCRTGLSQLISVYLLEYTLHSAWVTLEVFQHYMEIHIWKYHCHFSVQFLKINCKSVCAHPSENKGVSWEDPTPCLRRSSTSFGSFPEGKIEKYEIFCCLGRAGEFTDRPPGITCLLIKNPVPPHAALERQCLPEQLNTFCIP